MKNSNLFRLLCQSLVLDEYPELTEEMAQKLQAESDTLDRFIHLTSNH